MRPGIYAAVMVASGFSGPIAGVLVSRLGLRLGRDGRHGVKRAEFLWPGDDGFQHPTMAGLGG
ncbi:methyl viologen resistance protein SmvA [Salmonella enterica subsp. enterica]|uniref:Methyl viologen resistance protein SmvA n=1 Tax=Salmonella enterica I TaxID=59201 RepID=A0A447MSS4_SALET|nr:methyl viologen resistance protein SmvA [Salmonella enterica subsp. enterica]